MDALPFGELKVLDLAWVVAGPMIGRVLADFGATVIRVESARRVDTARVMGPFPGGKMDTRQSALYENCNAGKLGLALDLSSAQGQQVVRDLVAWADVLVESFSPGQMQRWGLGYESLQEIQPGLVMVSTSLMGQSGPYASFAGYGNVGAAMAGFQHLVGEEGELPIGPFGPYTDYVGPRFGLVALLAALDHRRRTGEGGWLDVSQAEAGIQFLAPQIADVAVTGTVAAACGNRDPQMAPHGVFRCGVEGGFDEWISIAVRDDAEWHALADLIGQPELAHDRRFACLAKRKENEAALEQIVSAWAAGRRAHVAEQQLQERGIPAAVAASSADMLADPQLAARGHFVRLDHPLMGTSTVESSRYQLSDTRPGPGRCAPLPGRDNAYVLRDILGYGESEIAALERSGVLS